MKTYIRYVNIALMSAIFFMGVIVLYHELTTDNVMVYRLLSGLLATGFIGGLLFLYITEKTPSA